MIELSMEEWGKRLLKSGRYKTIRYNYAEKYTVILDTKTGFKYEAKYHMATQKMILLKVK